MTELPPDVETVDPLAPDDDAPHGYMIDPKTRERRPKKLPGRPRAGSVTPLPPGESPSLEDLKTVKRDKPAEDRPPGKVKKTRSGKKIFDESTLPPFRPGPIAKGMNKLYARTGKFVRVMDFDIGTAIIMATQKESDDDITVGEAWEEVAKTNPRIRAFLLKMITGGAWSQLIMAHAPIFLAIMMKDGIKKHIPFMKLIEAMLSPDEETGAPPDMFGGMTPEDVQQATQFAMAQMAQMGFDVGRGNKDLPREPEADAA